MRHSSTPCQSGVAHATGSSQSGSWETGKNVPAKRNIGISTNRFSAGNHPSSPPSRLAENAAIGALNASPQSSAANGASTAHGETTAPPTAATAVKITAAEKTRIAAQPIVPSTSSATRTGVARTAW